jgi:hypothetical protein
LAQLPFTTSSGVGRRVLIRTDDAGGTHAFLDYLTAQRLSCSIGFGLSESMVAALALIPDDVWTPAYNAGGQVRDGAWVVEAIGVLDLAGWPDGMWVILREEGPHPGLAMELTAWLQMLAFTGHDARRWEPKR